MELLTEELKAQIPPFYTNEEVKDPIVQTKFFTPDSNWTWYVIEYNPQERLFYGLVIGFEAELGYFSLDELQSVSGPLGLPIERDLYFKPIKLSEIRRKHKAF